MSVAVRLARVMLRVLPAALRERLAVRLFMMRPHHPEPEREREWRDRGEAVLVAGLHATAFGPADGRAALLMHGWAGRGLQLSAYIEPLMGAGYRVIALDGPGHGRNHPGLGALPTFSAFLEDAIHETDPAIVIGHSLGAAAAVVAASRTHSTAKVLALAGPPETYPIFRRARRFMRLPESGWDLFMVRLMGLFDGYRTDDVVDIEACARGWGGDMHALLAADDGEFPVEECRRIVQAADGTVTVLATVGHRDVMWQPEAVQAGLRFLGVASLAGEPGMRV